MENECEALPGVAYPGVRDNRSTINTKTGYDDDDDDEYSYIKCEWLKLILPLLMYGSFSRGLFFYWRTLYILVIINIHRVKQKKWLQQLHTQ